MHSLDHRKHAQRDRSTTFGIVVALIVTVVPFLSIFSLATQLEAAPRDPTPESTPMLLDWDGAFLLEGRRTKTGVLACNVPGARPDKGVVGEACRIGTHNGMKLDYRGTYGNYTIESIVQQRTGHRRIRVVGFLPHFQCYGKGTHRCDVTPDPYRIVVLYKLEP